MVFGTNTVFGIEAGQSASGVPAVTVGYKRQEAVIMPLVANAEDDGRLQKPCDLSGGIKLEPGRPHPCLLVGSDGNKIDTYSVLASFGAQFDANGGTATAGGGLAQFFSTGVAAQALALRGGAALVATGEAAEKQDAAAVAPALAALVNDPTVVEKTRAYQDANAVARAGARAFLNGLADAEFAAKASLFVESLGEPPTYCANLTRPACIAKIESDRLISTGWASLLDGAVKAAKGEQ
jgi:hypothetical protein